MTKTKESDKLVLWFNETSKDDIHLVGSKPANLGEMIKAKAPILGGFTVTINAYFELLNRGGLKRKIEHALSNLDIEDSETLEQASREIKTYILTSPIPPKIEKAIKTAYRELSGARDVVVTVRSSATAKNLPEASFTGQQETYLYIQGENAALEATKKCWASLFTSQAIFYRKSHNFDHLDVGLAVPIQKMIIPEISGVMFTLEPITNDKSKISIEAIYGSGEGLVQRAFIPDRYTVNKKDLKILEKEVSNQTFQTTNQGKVPVSKAYQKTQKLADKHIIEVAKWGKKIEEYYNFPQDIEWVFSQGRVWIVQTRPVTAIKSITTETTTTQHTKNLLLSGIGASPKTTFGPVKILNSTKELAKIKKGDRQTATKIYVNLGEPELAKEIAQRNVDGVGLLQAELIFAQIGIHPQALIKEGKGEKLTNALYKGVLKMTKAFSPRPVIYQANDFKTSEYQNLKGGAEFEKPEANPILGLRGASRYIANADVFEIELLAIKRVRRYHKNLHIMIPFVRTPKELAEVKRIMSATGLHRGNSFKLWLMVKTPSNVVMLEEFIGVGIDGISIGSNDLAQLTLGVDRDNTKLANLFDENNDAVMWMIETAIKKAAAHGITSSICGQAPNTYPELTKKLVEWGITSVSVNPDIIEKTRKLIYEAEKELVGN